MTSLYDNPSIKDAVENRKLVVEFTDGRTHIYEQVDSLLSGHMLWWPTREGLYIRHPELRHISVYPWHMITRYTYKDMRT